MDILKTNKIVFIQINLIKFIWNNYHNKRYYSQINILFGMSVFFSYFYCTTAKVNIFYSCVF